MFAACAPVTNPIEAPSGRRSTSRSQPAATASTAAAAGEVTTEKPFWSHAVASQSAANDDGSALPITNPK